jgi:hypothetical protein
MIIVRDNLMIMKIVLNKLKMERVLMMTFAFLTGTVIAYGLVMKHVLKNILKPTN